MAEPLPNDATAHRTVALEAFALTKSYPGGDGPLEVVREVSLQLRAGELVALTGPSGSGKTCLLHLLVGFEQPDAGRVEFHGLAVGPRPVPWNDLAVVPQALGLPDELPVAESVAMPLRLRGRLGDDERARVADLLEALGIEHLAARRPSRCSLGEQQRTAVARALVARPAVLVVDEPTAHQGDLHRDLVLDALSRAAFEGTAVLAASHDPALAAFAHRALLMDGGRLYPIASLPA